MNENLLSPGPSRSNLERSPYLNKINIGDSSKFYDTNPLIAIGIAPLKKPIFQNILEGFEYYSAKTPTNTAVEYNQKSFSYREINDKANHLAYILKNINTLRQTDAVGVFLERSDLMVIGMIASMKANVTYVPQDIRITPPKMIDHIIEASSTKVILTLSKFKPVLAELSSKTTVIYLDEIFDNFYKNTFSNTSVLHKKIDDSDICFILFTSGTTGVPNGVKVNHQNLANILLIAPGNLDLKPGDKVGQILNISFDMSSWEIYGALANGATLVIRGKDIFETAQKVNTLIATPSVLMRLDESKLKNIKTVAVAGEPCPLSLAQKWSKERKFYNCCGPTETTIVNTMKLYQGEKLLTIGKPTPNNTVYILKEDFTPCEVGEIGEIWAGGKCVTSGYLNNPKLTRDRYKPDPFSNDSSYMFRTRDLGRWTKNGEIEFFGRTDDQVKINGFRIELDSVSNTMERHNDILRSVTLVTEDKRLVSFYSGKKVDEAELLTLLNKHLPYFSIPKEIHFLDKIPLTPRGKIDKRVLLKNL